MATSFEFQVFAPSLPECKGPFRDQIFRVILGRPRQEQFQVQSYPACVSRAIVLSALCGRESKNVSEFHRPGLFRIKK